MAASAAELAELYDSLSRFQWLCRAVSRPRPGAGLEMHKRLRAPPLAGDAPDAGAASLNDWLFARLELPAEPAVLDLGCGFGATLLGWARNHSGRSVGLTLSPFQAKQASREAERAGLDQRCAFRVASFDDPIEGEFDVVVSIETLLHAADLEAALANVRGSLKDSGQLVLVEDMARRSIDAGDDADVAELLSMWSTARLPDEAMYHAALAAAGFEIESSVDLTDQVMSREPAQIDRGVRRLRRLRRLLPGRTARRIADAFLGGLLLERLYAGGRMKYLAVVARPGSKVSA